MMLSEKIVLSWVLALIVTIMLGFTACGDKKPAADATKERASAEADAKVKEAVEVATDAYVYGYSLITTEVTRVQMSNFNKLETLRGPMNQFVNVPRYPPADYRGVSAPNADTLYSLAWLDLAEPQVFSHPDMGKRFHLFPMIDLWMTIYASPGSRTGDGKAAAYLCSPVPTGRATCRRG